MQVTKAYSGETTPGTSAARQISYGITNTSVVYGGKTDFLNQTIADFLHDECGVNATYEVRNGSTEKFLWINGVPFLFAVIGTYSHFYGPYSIVAVSAVANTLFSATASGVYSFSLMFTGNPETSFVLRFKNYNGSILTCPFCFMKAENVVNGKGVLVWRANNTISGFAATSANGIDLNVDGTMDETSFSSTATNYFPVLQSKASNKAADPDKIPLVPLMVGVWQIPGVYCHLANWNIPAAMTMTTENQTEFSISGRRFISTTTDTLATTYINMGLIEVTD